MHWTVRAQTDHRVALGTNLGVRFGISGNAVQIKGITAHAYRPILMYARNHISTNKYLISMIETVDERPNLWGQGTTTFFNFISP